jgi:DNA processing protein
VTRRSAANDCFARRVGVARGRVGRLACARVDPRSFTGRCPRRRGAHRWGGGGGGRVVAWPDEAYPPRLREIAAAPLALLVAGDAESLSQPALAIVGARRATHAGRRLAEGMAHDLAASGFVIVSGLAAGIDAAAHEGALQGGGRSVAVMATGLDDVYPSWHRPLAARLRESGALVTEFPTGTPAFARNFPRRNRIVSGLVTGVIVVEGALRSGSLITARLALDQNRLVFAVPGAPGDPLAGGPNALLRCGAIVARSVDDVLEDVAPQLLPELRRRREQRKVSDLTPEGAAILDAMRRGAEQLEDLVNSTGLALGTVSEALLRLELGGLIVQSAGKRFRRRAA